MNSSCSHEGVVGLDGLLKCRNCGAIMDKFVTVITKTQSIKRAKQIIEEIAVAGGYEANRFNGEFVVYAKQQGNTNMQDMPVVEEITATKIGDKEYEVTRTIVSSSDK